MSKTAVDRFERFDGQHCVYCGKVITGWDRFKGWFWKLPLRISEISQIWEYCCSYKCYGLQLEKMLKELQEKQKEARWPPRN